MRVISDFHIHGRFSRATSKQLDIANLEKWARIKGLDMLGTGDFTHPAWLGELKENLTEDGSGILKSESGFNFILQTEVSSIYTQGGKGRRIHNVILAPDFETVEQINSWLSTKGRLDYDGRPIFGFSCIELVENIMDISKKCEIIPAHCLTPWFSVFGSKSGFDTVEECFQDQAKYIHALETGLSADPSMIWRVSAWSKYNLVSFSDSHSAWPWRIGREATVFDLKELTYDNLIGAIRTKNGLIETLEFFPEEGKYHLDGHRNCGVCLEPQEAIRNRDVCPKCGKPLTIGVLHRVEELADRPEGFRPEGAIPFKSLVPLSEIIAASLGTQLLASKKVWQVYNKLIGAFGSEFGVMLEVPGERLEEMVGKELAGMILAVREGRVKIQAGYDGEYGKPIFGGSRSAPRPGPEPAVSGERQKNLLDFRQSRAS